MRFIGVGLAALLVAACGGGTGDTVRDGGSEAAVSDLGGDAPATDLGRDGSATFCAGDGECDDGIACTLDGCDPTTHICRHLATDADSDGHGAMDCGGDDCDDTDPNRYPGNLETCDASDRDEDCDPATFGYRDADGDGHSDQACCNGATCGGDCNDMSGSVHPGLAEVCDTLDNDCNGFIDDGVTQMIWPDADHDLHGDMSATPTTGCFTGAGSATNGDDCDDAHPTVYGGAPEICDMLDNDCNMLVDDGATPQMWWTDADGDMWGDPGSSPMTSCTPITGRVTNSGDCDDANPGVHPANPELCNNRDDDCDPATHPWDLDGDGHDDVACGGDDCIDSGTGADMVYPGTSCGLAHTATSMCTASGTCTFTCHSGGRAGPDYGNCDGDFRNGCETYLVSNSACGMCGHACLGGEHCGTPATGTRYCCILLTSSSCSS